jgi:hypothetical protein
MTVSPISETGESICSKITVGLDTVYTVDSKLIDRACGFPIVVNDY